MSIGLQKDLIKTNYLSLQSTVQSRYLINVNFLFSSVFPNMHLVLNKKYITLVIYIIF